MKLKSEIYNIDKEIGFGADGIVFSIVNDTNKVLKISTIYDDIRRGSIVARYRHLQCAIDEFKKIKAPCVAKIGDYDFLESGQRYLFGNVKQKFIRHFYVMERLYKIEAYEENRALHRILQDYDDFIDGKDVDLEKQKFDLSKYSYALGIEKFIMFYNCLTQLTVNHNDISVANIMKDKDNNIKLIDIDRATLKLENNYVKYGVKN